MALSIHERHAAAIEASAKAYLNAVNRHLNSGSRKKPARKKTKGQP